LFTKNEQWKNDYFTFIVNGAIEYLSGGKNRNLLLNQPVELEKERSSYFDKMDQYGNFIKDYFVVDACDKVKRATTYLAYQEYLDEHGVNKNDYTKQNLFKYFDDRYKLSKIQGTMFYKGLRLKTDEEMNTSEDNVNFFDDATNNVKTEDSKDILIAQLQEQIKQLQDDARNKVQAENQKRANCMKNEIKIMESVLKEIKIKQKQRDADAEIFEPKKKVEPAQLWFEKHKKNDDDVSATINDDDISATINDIFKELNDFKKLPARKSKL
jgi:hypothetical protein